ncbi:hypothetical protein BC940DRAFT_300544 [Gongronella butleri]|nr:hypothetical protein BC940DRAFT_300544 [Gongronella butleri]
MQRKSLWGSYIALPPRTRMLLGLGGMAFATFGMFASDYIEQQRPASSSETEEMQQLSPVVVVDHVDKSS